MTSIKILKKSLPYKKKDLLLILNNESSDSMTHSIWNQLEATTQTTMIYELQRVDLYNALRACMDEEKIQYGPHGKISQEYLMRVEDKENIDKTMVFLNTIAGYSQLENSEKIRSHVQDEGLSAFKERMRGKARKYQYF